MNHYCRFGLQHYIQVRIEADDMVCIYSKDELKSLFGRKYLNQPLKKIYVPLESYFEALHSNGYTIDLSYLGGYTLLIFENECLQIEFAGLGMFRYRCLPLWKLKLSHLYDYIRSDDVRGNYYMYDASNHFSLEFENQQITGIEASGTDCWPFYQSWFDEEKAEHFAILEALPKSITFHLKNGNRICFASDTVENYTITMSGTAILLR